MHNGERWAACLPPIIATMNGPGHKPDDLDAILRAHGGLKGLAEQLGQTDPSAKAFELPANDNEPRMRLGLWRLMRGLFPETAARRAD